LPRLGPADRLHRHRRRAPGADPSLGGTEVHAAIAASMVAYISRVIGSVLSRARRRSIGRPPPGSAPGPMPVRWAGALLASRLGGDVRSPVAPRWPLGPPRAAPAPSQAADGQSIDASRAKRTLPMTR